MGAADKKKEPGDTPRRFLFSLIKELRDIYDDIPASWVDVFLNAAQEDRIRDGGISVTELAEASGLSVPTTSRIVRILGEGAGDRGPAKGGGLLYLTADAYNHRIRRVCLTPAGKALVRRLNKLGEDPL